MRLPAIILSLFAITAAHAQTFTEHVRQPVANGATLTIKQSGAIDDVVNGKAAPAPTAKATPRAEARTATTRQQDKPATASKGDSAATPNHNKPAQPRTNAQKPDGGDDMSIPTVDMRRKVMRSSRKVNGYRVQAYAGGNSRADKQQAERIGGAIKMKYPDVPVYVHFYSPRWICRVGNFRTYEQAAWMLQRVKAMGYKGATIVQGKITVQY